MIYWSLRSTRRDPPQNIHLHRRIPVVCRSMHLLSTSSSFKEMERRFRQWKKQRVVLVATGNLSLDYWRPSGESETTFSDDHHQLYCKRVVRKTPPLVDRREFNLPHHLNSVQTRLQSTNVRYWNGSFGAHWTQPLVQEKKILKKI